MLSFGICTVISKTILELLNNGYLHGYVNINKIENINKRNDLEKIMIEYI